MSLAEILHRVKEQLFLIILLCKYKFNKSAFENSFSVKEIAFCSSETNKLPELVWDFQPSSLEVKQWLSGSWPALNCSWRWVRQSNCWKLAPDTRRHWPSIFFNSISYRSGNPYGDVRIAWEPSRLQQLVALALASQDSRLSVSKEAANIIEIQLSDWLESNSYLEGIHYISSMECGLRIISLCYALDIARKHFQSDSRVWNDGVNLIEAHALLIEKRLSLHSSSGNHTISEAVGLLYAGVNFPELIRAEKWKAKALSLLREESDRQILADGGSIEQSYWYLLFVSDLYGLASMLLDYIGESDDKVTYAFTRAREFISVFAQNPQQIPNIGDKDDGYALSKFLRISFTQSNEKNPIKLFKQSGYTVCRPKDDIKLIMDHGPLGMAPSYGHGHSDCLSLLMFDGDNEVLSDCGTFKYSTTPEWRKYFKGTSAHNTVVVNGKDQASYVNSFMWKDGYVANLVLSENFEDGHCILACHNGYESIGVTHWRGIYIHYESGCYVWDKLCGSGNHNLMLCWHTGVITNVNQNIFFLNNDQSILMNLMNDNKTEVELRQQNPILGWSSNYYGVLEKSQVIQASYDGALPYEFETYIAWDGVPNIDMKIRDFFQQKFQAKINES